MRTIVLLSTCLILTPALGSAQDRPDPIAVNYGNTIVLAIEPVWHARQYIDPDHTWRQVADDGETRGTWSFDGQKTCLVQTEPVGPTRCHQSAGRKVGDRWTNRDADLGMTIQIELVKGRD
jgi:hypothetical protein